VLRHAPIRDREQAQLTLHGMKHPRIKGGR
jgi:hypothetical protein